LPCPNSFAYCLNHKTSLMAFGLPLLIYRRAKTPPAPHPSGRNRSSRLWSNRKALSKVITDTSRRKQTLRLPLSYKVQSLGTTSQNVSSVKLLFSSFMYCSFKCILELVLFPIDFRVLLKKVPDKDAQLPFCAQFRSFSYWSLLCRRDDIVFHHSWLLQF
jgi:hypothetical protein